MSTLQTALLIGGAGLELVGIGLAVVDSLDVRRAFRERSAIAHVRTLSAQLTAHGTVVSVGGPEPTIEERIATVERDLSELRKQVADMPPKLHDEWREDLRIEAQIIRKEMEHQVNDLRRLLGAGVEPNRRRAAGFGLFALGLALQTASQFAW